ncbi:hypothetical protein M378DRAFT_8092 [Amanita muscaria Koide BX008]|uniref:Crinkler effector protein N-terminal domain-containing protein n=1 Tax=Amanita muscaria (strain Koide BX008) TaxID=946122 RepID=A0A0C2XK34_AMAMK|nr:hypothetical protein M378DRAFT_8092 [Amanita muscaria Koide BX008]
MSLRLNCLIEGEDIVFQVPAVRDDEVSDLKESIQNERALDSLKDVGPHTLELWKPKDSNPIAAEPDANLIERIGHDLSKFAEHIHIIVKVPRTGEPLMLVNAARLTALPNHPLLATISPSSSQNSNLSHGSLDDGNVLASLHELHTHLWGKDRIDHRNELACSILDLAPFDALNLIIRPDNILFIRNEYVLAYNHILERTLMTPTQSRATLVTGQPGIGKSLSLFYVLARRLHERGSVAFQIDKRKYCLFDQNGVTLHSTTSYARVPAGTWALSDTDLGARYGPCAAFWKPAFHVIHTSWPDSVHWKSWVKNLGASKYIMDVWGPEEFQTLLALKALNIPQGNPLFEKFGTSPRIIIDILTSNFNEDEYENEVNTAAYKLAAEFSAVFLDLNDLNFADKISSKVFTVRPKKTRRGIYTLEIPTPFLSHTFGLAMSRQTAAQQHTFFRTLSSYPSFCSAAGWLFEHYAHNRLSEPKCEQLGAYTFDGTLHHIPVPARMIAGSTALKRIQPPYNFYWRPVQPNFKGVDAMKMVYGRYSTQ